MAIAAFLAVTAAGPAAGQTSRGLEEIIVEQSSIIERFAPPPVGGSVAVEVVPVDRVPAGRDPAESVTIRTISIEGATLYGQDQLAPLLSDLVGRTIPLADLIGMTERIDGFYQANGTFSNTVVPDQDFAAGDIRFVVYDQSFIRTVEYVGDATKLKERLRPYTDRILNMQPIVIKDVERVLLLMSDLAGMNITVTLKRPDSAGAGGSMTIDVDYEEHDLRAGLDNKGSDETGPLELVGTYQGNDLFGAFEATKFSAATVPDMPRELFLFSGAQEFPIGYDGFRLGYQAVSVNSHPGGDAKDFGLKVSSQEARVYASYPFLRTLENSITGAVGLNARGVNVDMNGAAVSRDDYRWLSLEGDFEHDLGLFELNLGTEFQQGLGIFGATDQGDPLASNSAATPDFQLAQFSGEINADLTEDASFLGRVFGQYGFNSLPSMVKMSFGGDPFGRGFDPSVASGDSGVAVSLQLNHGLDLGLDFVLASSVYAFVDYGVLHDRDNGSGPQTQQLASAGIGMTAVLDRGFLTEVTLTTPVKTEPDIDDDGTRILFSVKKKF